MTKQEYMKNLQEKLERFGQELQEEILEDYRQHFAEGENEGKSDEEIIEELGNIEEMIRELSEDDLAEEFAHRALDPGAVSGCPKIYIIFTARSGARTVLRYMYFLIGSGKDARER